MTRVLNACFAVSSACLLLASGAGCQLAFEPPVIGSGNVVTEDRQVDSFDRFSISGGGTVVIKTGGESRALVTIDDNLQEHISSEVIDGELRIRSTHNYKSKDGLSVEASTQELKELGVIGSGSIEVDSLIVENLSVSVTGSGSINAKGLVDVLRISITGSGYVDLTGIEAERVEIDITGSGTAKVHALKYLSVDITGSGKVEYVKVEGLEDDIDITGSGDVDAVDP